MLVGMYICVHTIQCSYILDVETNIPWAPAIELSLPLTLKAKPNKIVSVESNPWCAAMLFVLQCSTYVLQFSTYVLQSSTYALQSSTYVLQSCPYVLQSSTYVLQSSCIVHCTLFVCIYTCCFFVCTHILGYFVVATGY